MYLILRHDATLPIFSGDSSANQSNLESSSHPSCQDVQQFQVQLALNVPAGWRMQGYHARLQDLFLKTYKKEQRFQMTLQARAGHRDGHVASGGPREAQPGMQAQKRPNTIQGRPDAMLRGSAPVAC